MGEKKRKVKKEEKYGVSIFKTMKKRVFSWLVFSWLETKQVETPSDYKNTVPFIKCFLKLTYKTTILSHLCIVFQLSMFVSVLHPYLCLRMRLCIYIYFFCYSFYSYRIYSNKRPASINPPFPPPKEINNTKQEILGMKLEQCYFSSLFCSWKINLLKMLIQINAVF